jgi:hypothetical protein
MKLAWAYKRALSIASLAVIAGGCVEPFDGSVVQMTLTGFRSPCELIRSQNLVLPQDWKPCTGNPAEDRLLFHYEIWATVDRTALFRLESFNVQTALLIDEQIALEQQGALLSDGTPFQISDRAYDSLSAEEQKALREQMAVPTNVYGITSYSDSRFGADGKTLSSSLYVGNYQNLQLPRNGLYFGQVNGPPPGGGALNVGGATLRTTVALSEADSVMITIEQGAVNRSPLTPSNLVIVEGSPRESPRGVLNVDARGPVGAGLAASFGFYHGLDEREFF